MSNPSENTGEPNETDPTGVPDEALPDDLVPGEDNPLAEGLEPGDSVDDLLTGGKQAEQDRDEPEPADTPGAGAGPSDTSQDG